MNYHRQACEFLSMLELTTWNVDRGTDMVAGMREVLSNIVAWSSREDDNRDALLRLLDLAEVDVAAPIDINCTAKGAIESTWANPKQDASMTISVAGRRVDLVISQHGHVLVSKRLKSKRAINDIREAFAIVFGEQIYTSESSMLAYAAGPRKKGRGAA